MSEEWAENPEQKSAREKREAREIREGKRVWRFMRGDEKKKSCRTQFAALGRNHHLHLHSQCTNQRLVAATGGLNGAKLLLSGRANYFNKC